MFKLPPVIFALSWFPELIAFIVPVVTPPVITLNIELLSVTIPLFVKLLTVTEA